MPWVHMEVREQPWEVVLTFYLSMGRSSLCWPGWLAHASGDSTVCRLLQYSSGGEDTAPQAHEGLYQK